MAPATVRRSACRAMTTRHPTALRLTVVVPAYLEEDRIGDAVRTLRSALGAVDGGVEIVVVDDGSTDRTADEARAADADRVIVHARNRGKGAAVRTGVLAARRAA